MTGPNAGRVQRLVNPYLEGDASPGRLQQTLKLAATATGFPHGLVNILDDAALYKISSYQVGGEKVVPRAHSMCNFTVAIDDVVAVNDLRLDARSKDLPAVLAGTAVSYLGVALHGRESFRVGTLCVFDTETRVITAQQIDSITQFGLIIEDQLDLLRRARERPQLDRTRSAELLHAIDASEIVPWFSPIVDLQSDSIVGYEALAQWERADGQVGELSQLLQLVQGSELLVDLRLAVMRQALAAYTGWRRPDLRLSLNLPTQQLPVPDAITAVHDGVLAHGVDPRSINLEITLSADLTEQSLTSDAVSRLRSYGYQVLLDGYGSGWSPLDWILNLPINGIKIDRAVTAGLGTPAGNAVTRAVLNLTQDLNLDAIAGGIDTPTQAHLARTLGIRFAQGNHWTPTPPGIRPTATPGE